MLRHIDNLSISFKIALAGLCLSAFSACNAGASQNTQHVYSTGKIMEIDRCASAWLIKRFVDSKAIFRFYPQDILITEGKAFDRPEGDWHRTQDQATFEVIAAASGIDNRKVIFIGKLIHDLEVNFWGHKTNRNVLEFAAEIRKELTKGENSEDKMERCFEYLDKYINTLSMRP